MYTHLLVPVDDSVLSSANGEKAVRLARSLGARITFFHASPDLGATREGARLRETSPGSFEESAFGDGHSVLAAHAVAADLAGVDYEVRSAAFKEPADAIVDAARHAGCDLIVMATHGRRGLTGLLHGSQTERVLKMSAIPVLVTRVEANDPVGAMEHVLAMLRQQHHQITAVTRGLRNLLQRAAGASASIDLALLGSMIDYLASLQADVRRPRQVKLVLDTLCDRVPACKDLRSDLLARHDRVAAALRDAREALEPSLSEMGSPSGTFLEPVAALAAAVEDCILIEESRLMPKARRHLQEWDWLLVAPAFDAQHEAEHEGVHLVRTRQMFTRLAELNLGVAEHAAGHRSGLGQGLSAPQ